jgi:hypothetical protein
LSNSVDSARVVEITPTLLSKEQFLEERHAAQAYFTWAYPDEHRWGAITQKLEFPNALTRAALIPYLETYQINWLPYLNLIDALNRNSWGEKTIGPTLEQFLPYATYQVEQHYETISKRIPAAFEPLQDLSIPKQSLGEHYRQTVAAFKVSDSLYTEQYTLPVVWSIYIDQFARKAN